jgi:fatty-acyl-CoA synthase
LFLVLSLLIDSDILFPFFQSFVTCISFSLSYTAGITTAWINFNIKSKGLMHCINISEATALIYGTELTESINLVADDLISNNLQLLSVGTLTGPTVLPSGTIDTGILQASTTAPDRKHRANLPSSHPFCYIYTSGTTGLPKAVVIPMRKYSSAGSTLAHVYMQPGVDRNYCVLPLFHSAGGMLGGSAFLAGIAIIIKGKFSASAFFKDCATYGATVTQYIGELCRYLTATPPSEYDTKHKLRLAIGNGMRPDIWDEFQDRFHIPEVLEFYGATEGTGSTINFCTRKEDRGAVGRLGYFLRRQNGYKIVKFDVEKEELVRDPTTGYCIECEAGEAGELFTPISNSTPFDGYKNPAATKKKIATNVFQEGDHYFRSGDLLSVDRRGYFYFVDRIGDTFRWKGENCSTTEVSECVSVYPGISECNAYGVLIPENMDGRAPMVAITPEDGDLSKLDLHGLAVYVNKELPPYAVPIFIRILPQIAQTATFKHQKVALRKDGIDLNIITDPIYWMNPQTRTYEPFGAPELHTVVTRQARL